MSTIEMVMSVVLLLIPTTSVIPQVENQDPDRIRIYTEEVVLPIIARDAYGHFDPTLKLEEILVLENGVPQKITSLNRIPQNLVFLIDVGTEIPATQHLDITRQVIEKVISRLNSADYVALIQFANKAEVLQDWTQDKTKIQAALNPEHGKLLSGVHSRLEKGVALVSEKISPKKAGSVRIILITDGVDASTGLGDTAHNFTSLLKFQPTLQVLSYTQIARKEVKKGGGFLNLDREMKRFYRNYEASLIDTDRRLESLVKAFGGSLLLPTTTREAVQLGQRMAEDFGAEFLITYSPTRPISSGSDRLPREIEIFSRRVGLEIRALRRYVTSPSQ